MVILNPKPLVAAAAATSMLLFFVVILASANLGDFGYPKENGPYNISSTPYTSPDTSVAEGYYDAYTISLSSGQTITITLTPGGSQEDPDLYLFIPGDGSQASIHGAGQTDSITYTAQTSGTYEIDVYGYDGGSDSTVSYTLEVSVSGGVTTTPTPTPTPSVNYDPSGYNDDPGHAINVPVGSSVSDYIYGNDVDWFRFSLDSYSNVTIETTGNPQVDTYIYLYSSNDLNNDIDHNDDGGNGRLSKMTDNLNSGDYYVKVIRYSWPDPSEGSGPYSIMVTAQAIGTSPTIIITPTPSGGGAPETCPWWDVRCRLNQTLANMFYDWIVRPISDFINTVSSGIQTIASTILGGIANVFNAIFSPIANAFSAVGNTIVNVLNTIGNAIQQAVRSIFYGGGGT